MTPEVLILPFPISVQMLHNLSTSLARYISIAHITPLDLELRYTQALDNLRRATALIPTANDNEMIIHAELAELFRSTDGPEDYEHELSAIAGEMIANVIKGQER